MAAIAAAPVGAPTRAAARSAPSGPGLSVRLGVALSPVVGVARQVGGRVASIADGFGKNAAAIWEQAKNEGILRIVMVMILVFLSISALTYYAEVKTFPLEFPAEAEKGDGPSIKSLGDGMWWTIVTMTTTGYGDLFPKTTLGRLVASILMISGLVIISLFTASFSALLVSARLQEDKGLTVLSLKDHIVIIGFNRQLDHIIGSLAAARGRRTPPIVLINQMTDDQRNELMFKYKELKITPIRGDATRESVLARANIPAAGSVVILTEAVEGDQTDPDDRTLFIALAVREQNKDIRIGAQIVDGAKEGAVRSGGVDEIVNPSQDTSFFLANAAVSTGLVGAARLLLSQGSGREIKRMELARELRGATFGDARRYYRANGDLLIGIISEAAVLTVDEIYAGSDWVDEFLRSAFRASGQEVMDRDNDRIDVQLPPPDDYEIGNKDSGIIISGASLPA